MTSVLCGCVSSVPNLISLELFSCWCGWSYYGHFTWRGTSPLEAAESFIPTLERQKLLTQSKNLSQKWKVDHAKLALDVKYFPLTYIARHRGHVGHCNMSRPTRSSPDGPFDKSPRDAVASAFSCCFLCDILTLKPSIRRIPFPPKVGQENGYITGATGEDLGSNLNGTTLFYPFRLSGS